MCGDEEQIALVERDRRHQERELLLLLLLLASQSRRYAVSAVRLGHSPTQAIRDVWAGNEDLDLPGLPAALAEQLAAAHVAGYRRASAFVGNRGASPVSPDYSAFASQSVERMTTALQRRVNDALAKVEGGATDRAKAVRQAFADGGYTAERPAALVGATVTLVVSAYGAGMAEAYDDADVEMLRHHSVLDAGTTEICNEREGLTLPRTDPYWQWNWPSLHFGCRSIVLPAPHGAEASDWRPTTPPSPGFGRLMTGVVA